jgi:hypothetical protein
LNDFGKAVRLKPGEVSSTFLRRGKGDHDIWTTAGDSELSCRFG